LTAFAAGRFFATGFVFFALLTGRLRARRGFGLGLRRTGLRFGLALRAGRRTSFFFLTAGRFVLARILLIFFGFVRRTTFLAAARFLVFLGLRRLPRVTRAGMWWDRP
jgi:hypothetical protein